MKTTLSIAVLLVTVFHVSAQKKLARYFPAADPTGINNVEALIDLFIQPIGNDICILPNNGWYSTAKTHKKWGFDMSVTVNSVFVSNEDKYYSFPTLTGLTFQGTDAGNQQIPTAYGPERENPYFTITQGPNNGVQYQGPDGFDPAASYFIEAAFIPTIQAGIGLWKHTDLRVRYTPKVEIESVGFGNWGVGLMHDIKQYITGETDNSFAISVFVAYTKATGTVDLSGIYSGSGQEAKVVSSGFTGQAIVSKEFSVLTLYGAVGFDKGSATADINGTYNVNTYKSVDFDTDEPLPTPFTLTNPFSYDYEKSGLRFTAGLRLRLGPITLNGDYSFVGDRRVLTLGLGFLTDGKRDDD
jgi:hypothetical protein